MMNRTSVSVSSCFSSAVVGLASRYSEGTVTWDLSLISTCGRYARYTTPFLSTPCLISFRAARVSGNAFLPAKY